jgi:KamA family protein/D-alanine--D-alanine ligase
MNSLTIKTNTKEATADEPPPIHSVYGKLKSYGADLLEIQRVKRIYPMKISPYYLNLIQQKDDPIWRQAVPSLKEIQDKKNSDDPLKEEEYTKVPYLVHKYPDRVLLLISSKCAMYCRFCTRKRKVGRVQQIPLEDIFTAIEYIRNHPEIRDVIISGGDPLMRTDNELNKILKRLREIPHIHIIRIGTRIPCVLPSRITKRLVNMLKKYHPLYMNIHFNHEREITEQSEAACKILSDAGIVLGSQTVLLKNVNDSPKEMTKLMQKLLSIRVRPYYIYQCDLVTGCEHFRTDIKTGVEIIRNLHGFTSGLSIPHFVIDCEGGKTPLSPNYIKRIANGVYQVESYQGKVLTYTDPSRYAVKPLKIGITYNKKINPNADEIHDKYCEFDDISTVHAIRNAIVSGGYEAVLIEADTLFLENLKEQDIDFVFNIAEGITGESRESHIPAILEMLNIPYSGSGVLTQAITLDKQRTKEILSFHGIPVPKGVIFRTSNETIPEDMQFPMLVKPNREGSSKGINNKSLVFNKDDLQKQIRFVIENYNQEAIIEEYCSGREFTVSIIGNDNPRILPIVEITFDYLPDDVYKFDSYEVKWIYDNPESGIDPLVCPAKIDEYLKKQIEEIALKTYRAVGCVDFCRIDIRLDATGVPKVLDINALPGLIPDPKENSRFPRACYTEGMSYNEIILTVLTQAMKRRRLII